MLKDPDHPITLKTDKKWYQGTRSSQFVPSASNTTRYHNSVLQQSIRTLRDGNCKNKYTKPTRCIWSSYQTTTKERKKTSANIFASLDFYKPSNSRSVSITFRHSTNPKYTAINKNSLCPLQERVEDKRHDTTPQKLQSETIMLI